MTVVSRTAAAAIVSAVALALGVASASAATTASARLDCGSVHFEVTGFGRGQVLHVVGSESRFIVTKATLDSSGQVVFAAPGLAEGANIVTCTTTSPIGEERSFTFEGFFTPAA